MVNLFQGKTLTLMTAENFISKYIDIETKEKKQEWLLLTFAILGFLIIGKGIYNEYYKIDQDYILVPLLMTMFGTFFLVYAINGITKGNLTPKWTPFFIFQLVYFLTKTLGSMTQDKAKIFSTKLLGALGLLISIGCFTLTVISLTRHN